MLFYPAALPLSTATLNRVARLIRAHRKTIGSRWRALDSGAQALFTLAYLRKGEALRDLAAGFGILISLVGSGSGPGLMTRWP
ncbi:transposase family protein [Glycomyces buryatensis]|uniref:Transposase family protein n=1 Tax=Glycomyces buryatensis TaxID=2570927 RepID=A0A4S8QAC6_9ACTN|nr:transposase family protein [Glycomyces buryatensis]